MRILLIVPTVQYANQYPAFMSNSDFPVGFAYIAAALKKAGHEVHGLNPNNDPSFGSAYEMLRAGVNETLNQYHPDLIGIGGLCTDFPFLRDTMRLLRWLAPSVPVVCGGGIINNDAEFVFSALRPDFCIVGEGEEIIVQLADMLEQGSRDFEKIKNIGYWLNGEPRFTRQDFTYPDLDSRSFPDYSPFDIDLMLDECALAARYLYRYTRPEPRPMTIVAARNCPFNCTFCVHNRGAKYRARSIENILEEIKFLYETYRFNVLIILDELFAIDKARLKKFCEAILEARKNFGWDFDWLFQTHANAALDKESLAMAKAAGCYYFSYGIESASPRVLASMNKKTHPEQISEAIRIADEVEIGFGGNFIFGDIAETQETITETLEFTANHCLNIHIFFGDIKPYPGSKLFAHCMDAGIIRDKLPYYESIDKHVFNMTSMAPETWMAVLGRVMTLTTFPFVKASLAKQIEKESPPQGNNIMLQGNKFVWKLSASCPHCAAMVVYREIADEHQARQEGISIITGCPKCNKRLRIVANKEMLQDTDQQILSNSPLQSISTKPRTVAMGKSILFISLEFSSWQHARSWSYTAHLGLEEGFAANGVDCLTIPTYADGTPTDVKSWLSRAKQLCEGRIFDQVWVEVVHTGLDESFLNWLETIAPVRVGLVAESLQYQPEAYLEAPHLRERRIQVEKRLRHMTHALTVDEADAEDLSSRGVVKALWWVSAVPERFIGEYPEPPRLGSATFCGALYGKRTSWLEHPELRSLLVKQDAPEDGTPYPALFEELHRVAGAYLANGAPIDSRHHAAFMSPLRRVRQEIFNLWIKGLQDGVAVVNLPSFFQGYAGRVFEGMAAGRPVITWEIPNRPRTNALFTDDAEILLFPGDSPEALTEHIRHIQRDPAFANRIAAAARRKLWRHHTVEKRIRQIMHWIETGVEPSYTEEYPSESLSHALQSFSELFSSKGLFPAADSLEQNFSAAARQKELATRLTQVNEAISCHDIARAITLLEETDRNFPGQVDIQGVLQTLRSIQKEESQSQRDDPYYTKLFLEHPAWSNPHPNDDEQARWACISQILQMVANSQRGVTLPRILDLGSGRGWLTSLASSFGKAEGIEPVEEVAAVAGKLFPHLTFSHGTAETLLKKSNFQQYDIVLNSEVIEHVPREEQKEFVKNLSMLVKKGGHAIITSPRAEAYDQWMEYTNFSRQPIDDWLTENELEGLFKEMGFRTIHFERIYYDMLGKRYILRPSSDEETREGVVALYQVWGFNKF